jgi:hypothetical protein
MDSWFPPDEFRFGFVGPPYEVSDPRVPERFSENKSTIELHSNDYTKQTVETSVVVQFINDFPIGFKSGGFIIKMKWKI